MPHPRSARKLFAPLAAALCLAIATPVAESADEASRAAPKPDSIRAMPTPARKVPITVYVVRHTEQVRDGSKDPPLSGLGTQRARALRNQMKSARLSAVFATPYRRSQGTAMPSAEAFEFEINTYKPTDFEGLATRIREDFAKKTVLVVGHSNTVPAIVEALGGPHYDDLEHDEFDKLFVLAVYDDTTTCARLTYGEKYRAVPEH